MQQKCLQKTFLERFFKVRNQNSQNSFYTKNFDCIPKYYHAVVVPSSATAEDK